MGLALFPLLVASCVVRPPEPRRSDPSGFVLQDGELQLESSLHHLDLLDVKLYPFQDAPGAPIEKCNSSNKDVIARKLAFRLMLGKPHQQEKAAEMDYYLFLQEASPAELMPVVHLRRHYKEGLLKCVLELTHGNTSEEKSNIRILTSSNFTKEAGKGYVLVDFMTHWCGPCKEMVPHLEQIALELEGNLMVGRLDVDRNRIVSEKFGIKQFPTLMILKDGEEVSRLEKGSSYTELRAWIQKALQGDSVID
jgi:thioredoxin 1